MKGYKIFITSAGLIIVIGAVIGLWMAGSPGEQRLIRLDQERTNRLDQIPYQVDEFYRTQKHLPASLAELKNNASYWNETTGIDPVTQQPFDYRTVSDKNYELCANFDRAASQDNLGYPVPVTMNGSPSFWQHPAGHVCFTRTVNIPQDLNTAPPIEKPI